MAAVEFVDRELVVSNDADFFVLDYSTTRLPSRTADTTIVEIPVAIPARNDVRVTLARVKDVEALVCSSRLLFEQEHEFAAAPASQRVALIALLSAPDRARVIVAERKGHVLGMVTLPVAISTALGGPVAIHADHREPMLGGNHPRSTVSST